jgi:hypothetical protein
VHNIAAEVYLTLDSALFVYESLTVFDGVLSQYSLLASSITSLKCKHPFIHLSLYCYIYVIRSFPPVSNGIVSHKRIWYDVWWQHFASLTAAAVTKPHKTGANINTTIASRATSLRRVPPPSVYT